MLTPAGTRLRDRAGSLSAPAIEASVLRRRNRRLTLVAGAALTAVAVLASAVVAGWCDDPTGPARRRHAPMPRSCSPASTTGPSTPPRSGS